MAEVAETPSPEKPGVPVPAAVDTMYCGTGTKVGVMVTLAAADWVVVGELVGVSETSVGVCVDDSDTVGVIEQPPGHTESFRTRVFDRSAIQTPPFGSVATPDGKLRPEVVATTPSPVKPAVFVPATTSMMPLVAPTNRITWLLESAMNKLPEVSAATP